MLEQVMDLLSLSLCSAGLDTNRVGSRFVCPLYPKAQQAIPFAVIIHHSWTVLAFLGRNVTRSSSLKGITWPWPRGHKPPARGGRDQLVLAYKEGWPDLNMVFILVFAQLPDTTELGNHHFSVFPEIVEASFPSNCLSQVRSQSRQD